MTSPELENLARIGRLQPFLATDREVATLRTPWRWWCAVRYAVSVIASTVGRPAAAPQCEATLQPDHGAAVPMHERHSAGRFRKGGNDMSGEPRLVPRPYSPHTPAKYPGRSSARWTSSPGAQ
jgi:hypothetical protein